MWKHYLYHTSPPAHIKKYTSDCLPDKAFSESVFWAHSMADDMTTLEGNFRQQNKSCFILGASGETGKLLLQELLERNIFSRITLIGRRQLTFEDKAYENLVSEMVFVFFGQLIPLPEIHHVERNFFF